MTDNIVDITIWIMWTVSIAIIFYYLGYYMGIQAGYAAGWNECIVSLGGILR